MERREWNEGWNTGIYVLIDIFFLYMYTFIRDRLHLLETAVAELAVMVEAGGVTTVCSRSMTTQRKVDFCFQVTLQLDYMTL